MIIIERIIYVIAINVDNILYVLLLFLFIIGRLCVSAGENNAIPITDIIPTIIFIINGNCVAFIISGRPMNVIDDVSKHIQLFDACNPNDGALIILYMIRNINNSLNIPNIIAINPIIINLLNVR